MIFIGINHWCVAHKFLIFAIVKRVGVICCHTISMGLSDSLLTVKRRKHADGRRT